ncbi:serine protease [Bradyrhizobium liaoningense]|uniref:S1 family peptidase n=1 Tax=Bradyrhizobium liaoningense TaxID=43992 RepID=UPI001BAC95DA|nr:serine protease [Bradyrhizobium liaoningense]MBR1029393.1 trypsin-like peptidase domain-containing protein [Bradyrhizobium liaoningense]
MPFPVSHSPEDDPRRFLIQDPTGVRHPIISLLAIDDRTGHATGLGTAFRIDPFGGYLTAQHVLEAWLAPSRPRATVVGLLNPGLVFGYGAIGADSMVIIGSASVFRTPPDDIALDRLLGRDSSRMALDCMMLSFKADKTRLHDVRDFLPLRLTGKWPKVGDEVMAIGFPELDSIQDRAIDAEVLSERMYGSIGRVTAVLPSGREHRPWPTFAVDSHWPGGMSGGPVFNRDGEVIGLVSSSDEPGSHDAQSYAFWFAPIPWLQRNLPHVDPSNAGWVRGWAVVRNAPWHVAAMANDRVQAEEIRATLTSDYSVRLGSLKAGSDDFMGADG